jgi:peptide/nickel transport system substrate-binding protein
LNLREQDSNMLGLKDHAGHRRRPVFIVAAISLLSLGAAACSSSGSSSSSSSAAAASAGPTGTPTGTLTITTDEPPQTFDPIQSTNSTVDQMNLNDYNALVQYPPGQNATLQPQLATSWTISPNGLDYTFNLASGVKFHDGTALTASDVAFTLNRIKSLDTGVASELGPYASAKVISPAKVELTLSRPYAPFLDSLSRVYILESALVSKHLGSDQGQTWLSTHDAGTGPYQLSSYVSGSTASFKYFPDYFQGWSGHHVANVEYKFIASPSAEQEALTSGQANIAMNIARSALPAFKAMPGYSVNAANTLEELYVFMNTQSGPTKNLLVREALSYAYNYSDHISHILDGYGVEASGPLPTGMACHENVAQPTYDLAKAKQLLAQAGESHMTLTMNYEPETFEQADAFLLLQSDLQQIGVTVKAVPTTFPQTMTLLKSPSTTPNLVAIYAFPVTPNPNEVLYEDYYSGFDNGAGYNFAQYDNPALDKLLLAAQATTSQAQECSLYDQAQTMIEDQYVGINVSNPQYVTVLGPNVHGYSYYVMHTQTEDTYDIWVS